MTHQLTILLLDTDSRERELTAKALRQSLPFVEIREIGGSEDFSQVLSRGDFDLVVTECEMGWTTGLAVLKAVKSRRPDCPVIMYTGSGSEELVVEAMKTGLDDYLIKAFHNLEHLARQITRVREKSWYRQALRESESRFRSLFDAVPVGLYRVSLTGLIVDANPAMVQMLAYPNRESLLMVNANDLFVNPEDGRRIHMLMECEGLIQNYILQMRRRDGTHVWAENNARAVKDESGEILYYEGSLIDISKRVAAEEALKERERFLSSVFASIQDGISILDTSLNIMYVNPAMERWYVHAMPIVGKKCYEAYHGRQAPCVVCPTRITLETGKAACAMVNKVGPDQAVKGTLELCTFPFTDILTGELKGIIEHVRDISWHDWWKSPDTEENV